MECIFCHKENIKTDFVYEDDIVMAFLDMDPINEGHVLLVPKAHYLDIDEVPDEVLSHIMLVAKRITSSLKKVYKPNGYSIMQNGGEFNDTGHFHLHIFPRYHGDGFGFVYGEGNKTCKAETAKKIKNGLDF